MLNELLRAWLAHGPAFFLFLLDFSARLHHRGSFFRLLHRFPLLPLKFLCVERSKIYALLFFVHIALSLLTSAYFFRIGVAFPFLLRLVSLSLLEFPFPSRGLLAGLQQYRAGVHRVSRQAAGCEPSRFNSSVYFTRDFLRPPCSHSPVSIEEETETSFSEPLGAEQIIQDAATAALLLLGCLLIAIDVGLWLSKIKDPSKRIKNQEAAAKSA